VDTLAYRIGDSMYVNLTNRCSNACEFCERDRVDNMNGHNLWLDKEPSADEIIADMSSQDLTDIDEVVFCGWGEPTYRYDVIKAVAEYVHSLGKKTRINTNGQGSLICGYDITCDIARYIDSVSISLNNSTAERYDAVCHSIFGKSAFDELLDFASKCKAVGVDVTLNVVDCIGEVEIEACRNLASEVGVGYRVRPEI